MAMSDKIWKPDTVMLTSQEGLKGTRAAENEEKSQARLYFPVQCSHDLLPSDYFWNGARSYTHSMTTSNRLARLYPDGTVLYSSRLTIKGTKAHLLYTERTKF
ncbi:hypothetical protein DICVIV_13668 [Dictyocaulus viviparus]|uniref:Neurotransmitter-gated ion-channel ligand-binding domain-containing protein n=1 Tax=Dictyocaulus viviparus TaxID=29172 RepID=A0A0D8X787_DICVI|nr:hypothetical protein DICVIV_13668 [Dictyocaulus viviparus]